MSTQSTALVKQVKTIEETLMDRSSIERFKAGIGELERFLTAEKLARVALTAVLQNSDLLECDPRTILAATLQLGQIGLLPDGFLGQAYLIPFDNTVKLANGCTTKQMQATAMVGYRGFGELIGRSGKANSHDAQVVFSEDEFEFAMGSEPFIRHIRKLGKRGTPIGSYSIVYMKEGPARFDIMDLEELDKIKKNARGSGRSQSPWNTWWEEMARKTPLRRLAKYVPLSPEFQRASTIDESTELGYSKFDEGRGEYVLEQHGEKEEKPPVQQPQRVQEGPIIVGEKVEATTAAEPNKAATDANPFTKEEPAPRELTYELTPEPEKPDAYDKVKNPNGIHISAAQHSRLWAVFHSGQEKAKSAGKKTMSDKEFLEYVKSKIGVADARLIKKSDKALYDEIVAYGGGEDLKMNGGR